MRTEREKLADMLQERAKKFVLQKTVDEDIEYLIEYVEEFGGYIPPLQVLPSYFLGDKIGEMTAEEKACHTLACFYRAMIDRGNRILQGEDSSEDLNGQEQINSLGSRQAEVRNRMKTSLKQRFSSQYPGGKFPGVTIQEDFSVWTLVSSEKKKTQKEENIPGYA